jgi:aminoglycoside 9-adenylyltransferase
MPSEVARVLNVVSRSLKDSIAGAYLFGSSVIGGLRPDSDLDMLVAVKQPVSVAVRRKMVTDLMRISGSRATDGPARPVEVTVVNVADVVPWRFPPRSEFVFGEWLRAEFEANRIPPPTFDSDLAVLLTTVRQDSHALVGPGARELFDPIPVDDLRYAIAQGLPRLLNELKGDERNVLLTLARMWVTLSTGEIVPKDIAALWVLDRLPLKHRAVLDLARSAYIGERNDDWTHRAGDVDAFVSYAREAIDRLARTASSR